MDPTNNTREKHGLKYTFYQLTYTRHTYISTLHTAWGYLQEIHVQEKLCKKRLSETDNNKQEIASFFNSIFVSLQQTGSKIA